MKEFFGNLNSADTTCWIDCECGQEDIFVSDSLVRCPKCGRGYKVNFTVSQYEKDEPVFEGRSAKSEMNREERQAHSVMLTVGDMKGSFHCDCGCNVFYKGQDEKGVYYECNGCRAKYREG